jgi:Na+-transporting NADH:ubiquinone oxidoreductase subunit NqrB
VNALKKSFFTPLYWGMSMALFISVYALNSLGFSRNIYQFLISVGTCLLLDILLNFWNKGKWTLPLTSIVSGLGIFILLDSRSLLVYFLAGILSIGSKHAFTMNGRHIFNPTNFGLLICVFGFHDMAGINLIRWQGLWHWGALFIILGTWVTFLADRWALALGYVFSFLFVACTSSVALGKDTMTALLPMAGPSFLLYTFFMITDPKTTPSRRRDQVVFGFMVAALEVGFRYTEFVYSTLTALFIVSLIWGTAKPLLEPKPQGV